MSEPMKVDLVAEEVLVNHQRMDIRSCLCGWGELGRSHAEHVVKMLRKAGSAEARWRH